MKNSSHNDPIEILGTIYEKMYERTAESLKKATTITAELLHKAIDEAEEKTIELETISKEDAKKLSNWLKRDLVDAANFIADTEYELKDWLGFETTLLETYAKYLLENTADPTLVELFQLQENAKAASIYTTGEITGPGTLICAQCGEVLHFHKAAKVPPCPKCHATQFNRKTKS
ncbi:hypothetical protein MNBD_GAMMA08-2395 [hydrothermal vent metagenome]|uniref:Zinc ribbon-containing protein n=1 Tax=hydrothermal vent metagenome TaxID=652676 RepID=A0A3B0XDS9_9ZZZZ